ncbi:MAG: hypothetical protein Q4C09_07785 [Atopobiaceae bacterium]|nr:hypothetical protein [Atopobiaceae bacterium]
MNDLLHVGTFFLIFAAVLVVYGGVIAATGDKNLLPLRAQLSIRNKQDVMRVGRIVVIVGLVIGVLALMLRIYAGITG